MIDKSRWSEQELFVFEQYGYRCVLCGFQYADTLHHEPPRSLNSKWIDEPWTQYPLCNEHHELIQDQSRTLAAAELTQAQELLAPGAIERIKEKYAATVASAR
jgi:hypothetical protein